MISENELRELADFVSTGSPALSLYLDTDLTQQLKEKCKLVLRDLLESVGESASDEDVARVEHFFDLEYDWQARGIAIFSAADQGFWREYPLTVPSESKAHTGDRLYLRPMTQFLAEYESYAVLLVDALNVCPEFFWLASRHRIKGE